MYSVVALIFLSIAPCEPANLGIDAVGEVFVTNTNDGRFQVMSGKGVNGGYHLAVADKDCRVLTDKDDVFARPVVDIFNNRLVYRRYGGGLVELNLDTLRSRKVPFPKGADYFDGVAFSGESLLAVIGSRVFVDGKHQLVVPELEGNDWSFLFPYRDTDQVIFLHGNDGSASQLGYVNADSKDILWHQLPDVKDKSCYPRHCVFYSSRLTEAVPHEVVFRLFATEALKQDFESKSLGDLRGASDKDSGERGAVKENLPPHRQEGSKLKRGAEQEERQSHGQAEQENGQFPQAPQEGRKLALLIALGLVVAALVAFFVLRMRK